MVGRSPAVASFPDNPILRLPVSGAVNPEPRITSAAQRHLLQSVLLLAGARLLRSADYRYRNRAFVSAATCRFERPAARYIGTVFGAAWHIYHPRLFDLV